MSVVINIVPGNLCLIVKSFTKRFFVTILAGSHYDYLVIILSLYSWSAGGINKTRIKEIHCSCFVLPVSSICVIDPDKILLLVLRSRR